MAGWSSPAARRCRCRRSSGSKVAAGRQGDRSGCGPTTSTRRVTACIPARRPTCMRSSCRSRSPSRWATRRWSSSEFDGATGCRACSTRDPLRPARWSRFSLDLSQAHLFDAADRQDLAELSDGQDRTSRAAHGRPAPKVKRTDAIQSFVSQETPIVTITDADGAVGTGYSYTIGTGGSSVMRLLSDHLAPRLHRPRCRPDRGDLARA